MRCKNWTGKRWLILVEYVKSNSMEACLKWVSKASLGFTFHCAYTYEFGISINHFVFIMTCEMIKAQNLWFLFPLFFSRSLALKSSTFLSENIIIWVKTLPYFSQMMIFFTQYLFLNEKRCHLMTFSWWLESKRTRARGKSNHKFRA